MKEFCNEAYYMIFSTLANRTRLAMIDLLKENSKKISEIAKALEQEEATIARNLKPMVTYGLVIAEEPGKGKRFSLNKEIVGPLSDLLSFHVDKYCPGTKECLPPEKVKEHMKGEAAKTTYIEHE